MNSKNDGNIIVNVNALQQSVNKSTICKEFLESKIKQKMVDMLKYADQVQNEFASKVEYVNQNTKRQKGVLQPTQTNRQKHYRENEEL